MELSDAQLNSFNHIPLDEVKADLVITERELKDYEDESSVLRRNPVANRVKIYMLEGKMSGRRELIHSLTQIVDYKTRQLNTDNAKSPEIPIS